MVRAAAKHFQPLLASLNSFVRGQGFAQYAVPAVALPKAGGFLGGSKRVMVPLSEPLPNVNIPNPASPKAPELQVGLAVSLTVYCSRKSCSKSEHVQHQHPRCLRVLPQGQCDTAAAV
jgi:hypothetical protein